MKLEDLNKPQERTRLDNEELNVVYEAVKQRTLTKEEVLEVAENLVERDVYPRTVGSAIFAITRMHILLHGIAPDGETQARADTMFAIPQSMLEFVVSTGEYDYEDMQQQVQKAKVELANRPVKLKKPDAVKLMSDYYQRNKDSLPSTIKQHRENIVTDLMNGVPVEQAFNRYI